MVKIKYPQDETWNCHLFLFVLTIQLRTVLLQIPIYWRNKQLNLWVTMNKKNVCFMWNAKNSEDNFLAYHDLSVKLMHSARSCALAVTPCYESFGSRYHRTALWCFMRLCFYLASLVALIICHRNLSLLRTNWSNWDTKIQKPGF